MADISDSVRIQQAAQRLVRWQKSDPGREFEVGNHREPIGDWRYFCKLYDERGSERAAAGPAVHDAIDAALDKAGAPT